MPGTDPAEDAIDHRKGPRRRGEQLERAIYDAVLAELGEVGYGELTMDRVADRAHTGKASIYRRWPNRAELVLAAAMAQVARERVAPDSGDVREDLLITLRDTAAVLAGPVGEAVRAMLDDTVRDPQLKAAYQRRMIGIRDEVWLEILRRGAERGQVRPSVATPQISVLAPVLLLHHFIMHGSPIADSVLVGIVDEVLLPLVRPEPPDRERPESAG